MNRKEIMSYTGFNLIGQCCRVLQEFIIRKILPQYDMGIWSLILTLQNMVTGLDCGVLTAAGRHLPALYDESAQDRIIEMQDTTLLLQFTQRVLGVAIAVLYFFTTIHSFDWPILLLVLSGIGLIFLSSINETFIVFYQTASKFVGLGKIQCQYGMLGLFVVVSLTYYNHIWGLLSGGFLMICVQIYLLRHIMPIKKRPFPRYNKVIAFKLLKFSLPFRVIEIPLSLLPVVDNFFVAKTFGLKVLAIYVTAKLIASQASQVPVWIGGVFIVKLTQLLQRQGAELHYAKELYRKLLVQYLIILPLITVSTMMLSCLLIQYCLSAYIEAVPLIAIFLLSLYVTPSITLIRNFWIVKANFKALTITNLLAFIAIIIGALLATEKGSLYGYAYAYLFSYSLYFFMQLSSIGREIWGLGRMLTVCVALMLSAITSWCFFSILLGVVFVEGVSIATQCIDIIYIVLLLTLICSVFYYAFDFYDKKIQRAIL